MNTYRPNKTVSIGSVSVGAPERCFIIAEIGGNFIDYDGARNLIDLAADCGVDAIKLQTFRSETLTTKKAVFEMENTGRIFQHEHFRKYELDEDMHGKIFDYARSCGLVSFSTPSHSEDVNLLEKFGSPAHKIGSDDAVNIPFLKHVARTGKPVLLSTGMCTIGEVERSVDAILEEGNDNIILFHCTTNYPTHPHSVNLQAMLTMQQRFNFPVGYSDHTLGIDTCYAAAVLGAAVLEFHFTHDKKAEGPDHMLSKEPAEAAELVKKVRLLPTIMGDGIKRPMQSEMNSRHNNRKSIVLIKDVKAGEKINPTNVAIKRPGYGIPCEQYLNVLGKSASKNLQADDVLSWDDIL